jgi:uncharacterized protein (DUF4415 family)
MAVRRIGSMRMPDQPSVWNPAPNAIPGDILSGAPDYGGQSLREAPALIVTESQMAIHEAPEVPTQTKEPKPKGKRAKVKAVLPPDASRVVAVPAKEQPNRMPINLRVPSAVLERYKEGGPGYQGRIIAVLELFLEEGGTFVEI